MQRRTPHRSNAISVVAAVAEESAVTTHDIKDKSKRKKCSNKRSIIITVFAVFASIMICLPLFMFQKQDLTEAALRSEIQMREAHQRQQQQQRIYLQHEHHDSTIDRVTSDMASARMVSQPSRWVDGEKMLKKKLQVLYDRQKEGKDLGVPVLTRYLGEDIPAWITPDIMEEAEWKKKVEIRYEEMRLEEEEWKKKMGEFISHRERDIGVTTP